MNFSTHPPLFHGFTKIGEKPKNKNAGFFLIKRLIVLIKNIFIIYLSRKRENETSNTVSSFSLSHSKNGEKGKSNFEKLLKMGGPSKYLQLLSISLFHAGEKQYPVLENTERGGGC